MRKKLAALRAVFIIVLISALLCSCAAKKKKVRSADDLDGSAVGVLTGTAAAGLEDELSALGASLAPYSSMPAMKADLKSGNIDCIITDAEVSGKIDRGLSIKTLDEPFSEEDYSIITAKENADLIRAINGALNTLTENGTKDAIVESYINGGDYRYETSPDKAAAEFSLSVAVVPGDMPYAFLDENGEWTGLDIDLARAVCDILGADMTVREEPKGELITAIRSGRADFGMGRLCETDENRELVEFSDTYMTSVQVMLVRP
ncbi:MAG: transporter substrate-binding domain-containing protein [Oscillospiraceae bacterium]|nr:transporter substrate-binding domain-containing protein [Oscillospiraceae bacterium]